MMAKKKSAETVIPDDVIGPPDAEHEGIYLVPCKTGYRMYKLAMTTEDIVGLGQFVRGPENGGILRRMIGRFYRVPV